MQCFLEDNQKASWSKCSLKQTWSSFLVHSGILHFHSKYKSGRYFEKGTDIFIALALASFVPCKISLLVIKLFTVGNRFVTHFSYYLHSEKQNLISWGLFAEGASHKSG
jgi:hypothetical protein